MRAVLTHRRLDENRMWSDREYVVIHEKTEQVAYYNLPRGKWSTLIKYTLRWRKWADEWQHLTARATFSLKTEMENKAICIASSARKHMCSFDRHVTIKIYVWERWIVQQQHASSNARETDVRRERVICFLVCLKVLLWQASVATGPHVFVIATCIRSELIIYLLVSCNKQLSKRASCARYSLCLYTYRSERETHTATLNDKQKRDEREENK